MVKRVLASAAAGIFMLGCSGAACGQEVSASLSTEVKGTVTDQTGQAAANASVSLTSNVAPTQVMQADAVGAYSFKALRAGTYHVLVSLSGFNDYQSAPIEVKAGQAAVLEVKLEIAGVQTKVEVSGDAPQVEVADPSVYDTLSSAEIRSDPLNGRNFTQLIALAPGVSNQTGQDEARVGVQGSAAYSVNGGRTEYNSFDLDGSDLLNVGFNGAINTLVVYPSLDAIGEMKILTSNYGAMYGRTASGTVLVSTKSGTSSYHGGAYYFNRNEFFNARNFFDQTKGAPLYRRHDLGGTFGGPIFIPKVYNTAKDKTFFFYSEEYRNEKTPTEFQQAVPTAAERSGNFSAVCPSPQGATDALKLQYPICPVDTGGNFRPRVVDFENTFPNRNTQAILKSGIIPLPNSSVGCNSVQSSCYVNTVSEPTHWREELFRLDHYITEKNRLMFRYAHDAWDTITPTPQFGIIQNTVPTVQNNFIGPGISTMVRFSQTLSPTLLNEAFFGYINSTVTLTDRNGPGAQFQRPAALDAPCSSVLYAVSGSTQVQCPLGSLFANGNGGKMPALVFQNDPLFGSGAVGFDASYMPWKHSNPVYTFGDSMSNQVGKHFLQFGSEFILYYRDQVNSVTGTATGDTQGILTYAVQQSSALGSTSSSPFPNSAWAAFLIEGRVPPGHNAPTGNSPYSYEQDSTQAEYNQRYQIAEPFIQDDWKVTRRFTLNLGLRLSLFGRYHEKDLQAYNWLPSSYNRTLASQVTLGNFGELTTSTPPYSDIPFDPNNPSIYQLNGLVRCGYNGVPSGCMTSHVVNPAPRVGFAWDIFGDGKTSLRGGYGIFFEHGTGSEANSGALEGGPPNVLSATEITGGTQDISCIGGRLQQCGGSGNQLVFPINLTHVQTNGVWPYVQQWSLSFQRQLPYGIIATAAFVGSKGTHLTAERQINNLAAVPNSANPFNANQSITASNCNRFGTDLHYTVNDTIIGPGSQAYTNLSVACAVNVTNLDLFRPYLGLGQILSIENIANSAYRSFQATAHKTQGPVTVALSYTYGYSYDSSSDRFDPIPDAYNLKANWAPSNFDQRHLLNISYLYNLPFGYLTGRSHAGGWTKTLLDGWQLGGITVFQTGIPFSVINEVNSDNAGVGGGFGIASLDIGSYPDLVGKANAKSTAQNVAGVYGPLLYNPNAFVAPRGLTFGDAGRNSLRNPNRWNFDMSLFKNIHMPGEQSLQFRAEAFNVFNVTQFEIYNPGKRNQANNEISCYGGADNSAGDPSCLAGSSFLRPVDAHRPRTLQLALKYTF